MAFYNLTVSCCACSVYILLLYFRSKAVKSFDPPRRFAGKDDVYKHWLRTNGDNTNGAAAKVMNFDRSRKKVRPGTLGKIKVG